MSLGRRPVPTDNSLPLRPQPARHLLHNIIFSKTVPHSL